jgi:hypothetical protein
MRADDPRHGTNAGAIAHWKDGERPCTSCMDARQRARKHAEWDKHCGRQLIFTATEVRGLVSPWLEMGLTHSAIVNAAGFESQRGGRLLNVLATDGNVRRATFHRLAAVTEDDFAATAKVFADLTRRRIYSLMAAGHRLADMPINPCGWWRQREHVTVETARTIRSYYRAHEFEIGPSPYTATRARNAGHRPPLAWDDPDTLAWDQPADAAAEWRARGNRPADELLDEWDHLGGLGVSIHQAARQLGVTVGAIEKAIERAKERAA